MFGEGPVRNLTLVGEQPGDVEDREGRSFVGPAAERRAELLEDLELVRATFDELVGARS